MEPAALLPPSAGALERALDRAAVRATAIPAPLRSLWRPAPPEGPPPETPPQVWTVPVTAQGEDGDAGVRFRGLSIHATFDKGVRVVNAATRRRLPAFDAGGPEPLHLLLVDFRIGGGRFRVVLSTETGRWNVRELAPDRERSYRLAIRHSDTGRGWDFAFAEDIDPSDRYEFTFADYAEALARFRADDRFDLAIYDPLRLPPAPPGLEVPDACPAALLPWLAWALGVSAWNPDWPEAVRRRAIAGAFADARAGGTRAAILEVLRSLDAIFTITERHAGPFTCRVEIHNSAALDAADLSAVEARLAPVWRASVARTVVLTQGFAAEVVVASGVGYAAVAVAFLELEV